jgi:NADPH-dependent curcumin reductase CurA
LIEFLKYGQVFDAYGVAKVVVSGNPKFEKGELVVGRIGWEEHSVIKEENLINKLDPMGFPLTYHAGVLGK